jgi:hypothetical protein
MRKNPWGTISLARINYQRVETEQVIISIEFQTIDKNGNETTEILPEKFRHLFRNIQYPFSNIQPLHALERLMHDKGLRNRMETFKIVDTQRYGIRSLFMISNAHRIGERIEMASNEFLTYKFHQIAANEAALLITEN